ncbi:hypothetical protein SO802_000218 [Lithocarpus litseifolius]|uniref:CWZF3/5/7 THD domain-containing protein n=1 Tax=Lithocarpus litseifolius TaxID=425828 RepID=A0AAW2DUN3_9ROSI
MAPSYNSPQTVIPTPSLQTPHIELMSTSPSHTQSPPTSSTLIHVPQATHPHDSDVEQGQCDQAEQLEDANAHDPPKRKSTRAIQPRRCGTGSHLALLENKGLPVAVGVGIPGLKVSLLEEFGIHLITYDLPGFSERDPHPKRNLESSAMDMLLLANDVGVNGKFWVVGYSSGSMHAWAALRYIPDRLADFSLTSTIEASCLESMGMDDRVVPPSMIDFVHRVLPGAAVHKLPYEGHFTYVYFCDECHRQIFTTLFGTPQGPLNTTAIDQAQVEGDSKEQEETEKQEESPSSSASDADNLYNQAMMDKMDIAKDGSSLQVTGNHVIAARNQPKLVRLLDFNFQRLYAMQTLQLLTIRINNGIGNFEMMQSFPSRV